MEIKKEREVVAYLEIPNIPKKKWDGKQSFKTGVAVTSLVTGEKAYAIATFDSMNDVKPHVTKVFTLIPFDGIEDVFIVPDYMNTSDVDNWDLDEDSKQAAETIIHEAENIIEAEAKVDMPENEYFFPNIHNDEEARAFIKAYNKRNRIKGRIPTDHDTLVMRLSVMWADKNK